MTYSLWFESDGFAIIATPDATSDNYQQCFFCVVERGPNKEYADGLTNFYCYNVVNAWNMHNTGYPLKDCMRNIMRPFAFTTPEDSWNSYNYGSTVLSGINAGISFPIHYTNYAYRSSGNNKVYFNRPIIMNSRGFNAPIFYSELFFVWSELAGLVDGDIVMIEGVTKKYICRVVWSPDQSNRLVFAIKYAD